VEAKAAITTSKSIALMFDIFMIEILSIRKLEFALLLHSGSHATAAHCCFGNGNDDGAIGRH
jgi:hypothetical protein